MKKQHPYLLVLSLFILSACSQAVFTNEPPSAAKPIPQTETKTTSALPITEEDYDVPADPVRVSYTLASEGGSEALIPVSGGVLSTTAADGTVFTLTIPPDALVIDTLIRMTPVATLEGMPFGSQPLLVDLEPEGLQLYAYATLTITSAELVPVDQQIFVSISGATNELTLALPVVDSAEIQLLIDHFSAHGFTKGMLADIEPVRERLGGSAERRLQSKAAEILGRERQTQLLGGESSDWIEELDGLMNEYQKQVIEPRVAAAGQSCAAARLAIQTVLGFDRQRQLLGLGSDESYREILTREDLYEVCVKEEYEICRDQHIIHRIIPVVLGMERQYQLLGGEGGTRWEKYEPYIQKCLSFELEFHSETTVDLGEGEGYTSSVDSKIKLKYDPTVEIIKGESALINTAFEWRMKGCSVTSNRGGSTFVVTDLMWETGFKDKKDELGYVKDFTLKYFPGNTSESATFSCPDSGSFTMPASPLWTGSYLITHEMELDMVQGFVTKGWEILGKEYYAKKEWILESTEDKVFEAGTFKLYHKPEK